jgi:hypothetical protein
MNHESRHRRAQPDPAAGSRRASALRAGRALWRLARPLAALLVLVAGFACNDDGGSSGDEFGPVELFVTPGPTASTNEDLWGNASVETPAFEPVTFAWSWTVDGVDAGVTDNMVPASSTAKNQVWEVTAVASFSTTTAAPVSAQVLILNSTPTITSAVIVPEPPAPGECTVAYGSAQVGDPCTSDVDCGFNSNTFQFGKCQLGAYDTSTLTVQVQTQDPDGEPVTVAYVWTVNGVSVATTPTLEPSCGCFAAGDVVGVVVTPSDGQATGPSVTAAPVTIVATPPAP